MRSQLLILALALPFTALAADTEDAHASDTPAPTAEYCASEQGRDTQACRARAGREAAQEVLRDAERLNTDPVRNPAILNPPPPPPAAP